MRMSAGQLQGRAVIGSDGLAIGDVSNLYFDTETWEVTSIELKFRKEIGRRLGVSGGPFKTPKITLPVKLVQSVSDAIVLTVPTGDLRSVMSQQGEHTAYH